MSVLDPFGETVHELDVDKGRYAGTNCSEAVVSIGSVDDC